MLEKSHSTTTQLLPGLGEYRGRVKINKQFRSPEVFQKMPDHQPHRRDSTHPMWVDTSTNKKIEESSNICKKNNFKKSQLVAALLVYGAYPLFIE